MGCPGVGQSPQKHLGLDTKAKDQHSWKVDCNCHVLQHLSQEPHQVSPSLTFPNLSASGSTTAWYAPVHEASILYYRLGLKAIRQDAACFTGQRKQEMNYDWKMLKAESTLQILDPHGWKNPVLQNVCLRSGRRSKFLFDCFNGPIEAIQAKENCQAKHSHPSPVAHVLSCRARDLAAIDWFRFSFPLPRVDRQNLQTSLVGRSTDHTPCSQHTKYIFKKIDKKQKMHPRCHMLSPTR